MLPAPLFLGIVVSKRGKDPKVCNRCKVAKPRADFYPQKTGVSSMCRPCHGAYTTERSKKFKARAVESSRRWKMKSQYGITLEQYDQMLEDQGGVCAICGTDDPRGMGRFPVDHCHDTGQVRGLLCNLCNQALGMFKDDPQLLLTAVSYLRRFGK